MSEVDCQPESSESRVGLSIISFHTSHQSLEVSMKVVMRHKDLMNLE